MVFSPERRRRRGPRAHDRFPGPQPAARFAFTVDSVRFTSRSSRLDFDDPLHALTGARYPRQVLNLEVKA